MTLRRLFLFSSLPQRPLLLPAFHSRTPVLCAARNTTACCRLESTRRSSLPTIPPRRIRVGSISTHLPADRLPSSRLDGTTSPFAYLPLLAARPSPRSAFHRTTGKTPPRTATCSPPRSRSHPACRRARSISESSETAAPCK